MDMKWIVILIIGVSIVSNADEIANAINKARCISTTQVEVQK